MPEMTRIPCTRHWPTPVVVLATLFLMAIVIPGNAVAKEALRFGGPFALTDQNGQTITNREMLGRPYLIFFGFTHCCDVDTTTLSEISSLFRKLGPDADRVAALFVTVDPQRDTPRAMKEFLSAFDPHIRGLTGSVTAVDRVMKEYHVYRHKVAFKGGYAIDHTTTVYLVNKNGKFVGPINMKQPPEDAAAALRRFF